jgi:hypothetical protein
MLSRWTSLPTGVLAAGCALAASVATMFAASSWVSTGFSTPSAPLSKTATSGAASWGHVVRASMPASNPATGQTGGPRIGDEQFWLSGAARSNSEAQPARLAAGDKISITGKSRGAEELEVVDVKPIDAGLLLPVVAGQSAPRLVLVICKVLGETGNEKLVRVILEDPVAIAPVDTVHKAL